MLPCVFLTSPCRQVGVTRFARCGDARVQGGSSLVATKLVPILCVGEIVPVAPEAAAQFCVQQHQLATSRVRRFAHDLRALAEVFRKAAGP